MNGKELFEFQMATLKVYDETIKYVQGHYELSNVAMKHTQASRNNLALYEVGYDTCVKIRSLCDTIMGAEKVDTVEELLKNLSATFWD